MSKNIYDNAFQKQKIIFWLPTILANNQQTYFFIQNAVDW